MIIDNWEVTILKDVVLNVRQGDDNSPDQHIIDYDFRYIPFDYHVYRTIQYIKPHGDDARLVFLKNFLIEQKKTFIDPIFNQEKPND
jgi:hypothetical protein